MDQLNSRFLFKNARYIMVTIPYNIIVKWLPLNQWLLCMYINDRKVHYSPVSNKILYMNKYIELYESGKVRLLMNIK